MELRFESHLSVGGGDAHIRSFGTIFPGPSDRSELARTRRHEADAERRFLNPSNHGESAPNTVGTSSDTVGWIGMTRV
jgi:hypothetical protein